MIKQILVQLSEIFCKVVFGEVVDGMDTVKKIEELGSQSGRTQKKITIANSGVVEDDQKQK
jgi:cyclophilin family peptidyl-prolyl cis-trans isomerase